MGLKCKTDPWEIQENVHKGAPQTARLCGKTPIAGLMPGRVWMLLVEFVPRDQIVNGHVEVFRHTNKHFLPRLPLTVLVLRERLSRDVQIHGDLLLIQAPALADFF